MNHNEQIREPPKGGSLNFSHIIDDFQWSYLRIRSFDSCKYGFLLSYIKPTHRKKRNFFSDYGSFVHKILEQYYLGILSKDDLVVYYLSNFSRCVSGNPPGKKVFVNYFTQGLNYFKNFVEKNEEVLGVEQKVRFSIDDKEFVGFIDKVSMQDGSLIITDNKSHNLQARSNRKKPTKSDEELDEYLKQLYLYAIPMQEIYGRYQDYLSFNCFRCGTEIMEPFSLEQLEHTKQWAIDAIHTIREEKAWTPNVEFFKCKYICDHSDDCEYFQMS